jgi:hypothetical protein
MMHQVSTTGGTPLTSMQIDTIIEDIKAGGDYITVSTTYDINITGWKTIMQHHLPMYDSMLNYPMTDGVIVQDVLDYWNTLPP